MLRTKDDTKKADTEILEGYFKQYKQLKIYVEGATTEEKQTEYFKHRLRIVEGVDKIYPELTDVMKRIVHGRYWYKDYQEDWAELADELGMKPSAVKRHRDILIRRYAEAIYWV